MQSTGKNTGRPKKKSFPKKYALTSENLESIIVINDRVSESPTNLTHPIGLLNNGENICFINSAIQLLYNYENFRSYIKNLSSSNEVVLAIKALFNEIDSSSYPVKSSKYLQQFNIPFYIYPNVYDSHEFLVHLLDKVYPRVDNTSMFDDNCMFNVKTKNHIVCKNSICNQSIVKIEQNLALTLNVKSSNDSQTINDLLNEFKKEEKLPNYTCETCKLNNCEKTVSIENCPDILILQLSLFAFSGNTQIKLTPTISLDENIVLFNQSLQLHGIIYHEGPSARTGHYTCCIKKENSWFWINDSSVQSGVKLSSRCNDSIVPYIILYKKIQSASLTNTNSNQYSSLENICETNVTPVSYADAIKRTPQKNECCNTKNCMPLSEDIVNDVNQLHKSGKDINKMFVNLCNVVENSDKNVSDSLHFSKQSVVKELFQQTEKIAAAKEKNIGDMKKGSKGKGIKRKSKFTLSSSKAKESDKKRKQNIRANMPEEVKEKENATAKTRMKNLRGNMPEQEKTTCCKN
mgnify:CR=1 FL=1